LGVCCETEDLKVSRLSKFKRAELNESQQEQFDRVGKFRKAGDDGQYGGPFDPWIRSPELAKRAVDFGGYVWERTTLDRGIVELAIIITARYWRSNVEWAAHAAAARTYGISEEVIDSVFNQKRPVDSSEEILATYDFCSVLHETKDVPKEIYDQAVTVFGEQGVVEMIATIGYYTMVSMTLNTFDIGVGPGVETPFPRD
ncbi:MAG: carboxymuconolactone decarboxylase family protein, partial [Pseudomonadales bacterium]|nr:carboxymuconolactone decarboxylase family protein [Pseudomonadales bacterium]